MIMLGYLNQRFTPPLLDCLRSLEFLPIPLDNEFSNKHVALSKYSEAVLNDCKAIMDTIEDIAKKDSRM